METLTAEEQQRLQSELGAGETVLWSGKPDRRVIFHPSDWGVIPFSVLWSAFSILWEAGVSGYGPWGRKDSWGFGELWGVPFVLIGQYMVWGRFLYTAWKKNRITYALTTERIIVLVRDPQAKVISMYLRMVKGITREVRTDGIGTLKFGEVPPIFGLRGTKTSASDGLYLKLGNTRFR